MVSQTPPLAAVIAQGLADPRDCALFGATPLLMMPRFGTLPPLDPGRKRFVAAADGIYLQARTQALSVTLRYAETPPLPYGSLQEDIQLAGGLIPRALFEDLARHAVLNCPREWAAVVHWNPVAGQYEWTSPDPLTASPVRFSYGTENTDEQRQILDLHTHGAGNAFFSPHDDVSDIYGVYFATVLGRCERRDTLTAKTRLVVDGIHHDLPWHPWEDADPL